VQHDISMLFDVDVANICCTMFLLRLINWQKNRLLVRHMCWTNYIVIF